MGDMFQLYAEAYKHHSAKYGADTAIFYLVGSFYELYDWEDPKTGDYQTSMRRAVDLMGLKLVPKPKAAPKKADGVSAGFKEDVVHKFASMLTRANWTVVIYDQVKNGKGDVTERRAVRVLSPGTHVETASIESVYMGSLWLEEGAWGSQQPPTFGAAALDLTTGRITTYEGSAVGKADSWMADDVFHFFQVHAPRECIVWWKGSGVSAPKEEMIRRQLGLSGMKLQMERVVPGGLDQALIREEFLRRAVNVKTMLPLREALELQGTPRAERALCHLLQRLEEMYPSGVKALHCPERWVPEQSLFLGNQALLQLNMIPSRGESSILGLFEKAITPLGKRAIRERLLVPSADPEELERRYSELETLETLETLELSLREQIVNSLRAIGDLPRIHRRIHGGEITPADVLILDQSYASIGRLSRLFEGTPLQKGSWWNSAEIQEVLKSQFCLEKARKASEDSFCFQEGIAPAVEKLESEIEALKLKFWDIKGELERWAGIPEGALALEFRETLPPFLGGGKGSMAQFGKCLKQETAPYPGLILHSKKSAATVELPEFNSLFHRLQMKRSELASAVQAALPAVCEGLVRKCSDWWDAAEEWVALVDVSYTLWRVSKENGFVKPTLLRGREESQVSLEGLRHPLIENTVSRVEYVTHTVSLVPGNSGWLVYGMNASGKSSLMKAVGISVLLAQAGCYVPAKRMEFVPFKRLFTRILNMDNLWAGLSSFAVEMTELREILQKADSRSLVLGDELCSGTESMSATSLVGAGLQWLSEKQVKFIFATHLHGLVDIPGLSSIRSLKIWHLKVRYDPVADRLIYERTLTPGAGSSLYGLEVARAMSLPEEILKRAMEIRRHLLGTANESEAPTSHWNSAIQRRICEQCGSEKVRDLEVHHLRERATAVDGTRRFEDGQSQDHVRNLMTLCQTCHDKIHSKEIVATPVLQTSDGPMRVQPAVATAQLEMPISLSQFAYQPAVTASRGRWTEEQRGIIESYLRTYPNCPPKRILYDLEEKEGIKISLQGLRSFRGGI